jgi:hypothetical protein
MNERNLSTGCESFITKFAKFGTFYNSRAKFRCALSVETLMSKRTRNTPVSTPNKKGDNKIENNVVKQLVDKSEAQLITKRPRLTTNEKKKSKIFPRGTSPSVKPLVGQAMIESSSEEDLGADSKALRLKLKPVSQEELLDAIVRY